MKNFVIMTREGYTVSPYSEEKNTLVENLQLLGFAFGSNKKEAVNNFVLENDWVTEEGISEVIVLALENGLKEEEFFPLEL